MSHSIFRTLLGPAPELEGADARYRDGLVSSYAHRGKHALLAAGAIAGRLGDRARRELFEAELRRAEEHLCKAARVAHGLSATRSRDLKALLFGGPGVHEPLPPSSLSGRLERIAEISERVRTEPHLASDWLRELRALAEEVGTLRVRKPHSRRRATPRRRAHLDR